MDLEELQGKYNELMNENSRLKKREKGVRRKRRQNKRRTKE